MASSAALSAKQDVLSGLSVTGSGTAAAKLISTNPDTDLGSGTGQATFRLLGNNGGITTMFTNQAFFGLSAQSGATLRLYSSSWANALDVTPTGNLVYYGTLTSASDQRLKTQIEDVSLTDCQILFDAVTPKTYKRTDQIDAKWRIGVLAQ